MTVLWGPEPDRQPAKYEATEPIDDLNDAVLFTWAAAAIGLILALYWVAKWLIFGA